MADRTSAHPKNEQDPGSNTIKDPDNWTTGDEPATGAQESYLHTLAEEAHDAVAGLAPGARTARWRCAFQVTDCAATVAAACDLGGEVVFAPTDMGLGDIAELRDPWGTPFAVTAPATRPVDLGLSFGAMAGMELTFPG